MNFKKEQDQKTRGLLLRSPFSKKTADDKVCDTIRNIPKHESANLVVDLAQTTLHRQSFGVGSGFAGPAIGQIIDLLNANTYTNLWVAGGVAGGSGEIIVQIQTSDATTSGSFTDPTSGLARFPVNVLSGGLMIANSGIAWVSGSSMGMMPPVNNAPVFCSGGIMFGAFQRPHQYARLNMLSGAYPGAVTGGFIGQARTTGSGGGFTFSPTSGTVNV